LPTVNPREPKKWSALTRFVFKQIIMHDQLMSAARHFPGRDGLLKLIRICQKKVSGRAEHLVHW
jgi:hypothetical protein